MKHTRQFSHSNNPSFNCQDSVLILPFGRKSYLSAIIETLDAETIHLDETTDREVFNISYHSTNVTLVFSGMGSPAMVNALEMVKANGGKRVVLFGACGGVSPLVQVGDIIIPNSAVRGEGASRYYAPIEFPASCDVELTHRLLLEADSHASVHIHNGYVYTTDASYRQGPDIYKTYQDLILGVECECAAAAVAGYALGLKISALFFCTDNVLSPEKADKSYQSLSNNKVRKGFDIGLKIVMNVLAVV